MPLFPKRWFNRKAVAKEGYLYVISNPSMPGLVKVGMTSKAPVERMKSLYSTSVPTPFEAEYFALCGDRMKSETIAHQILKPWRVNSRREFFRVSPEVAIAKVHFALGDAKVIYTKHKPRRYQRNVFFNFRTAAVIAALVIPWSETSIATTDSDSLTTQIFLNTTR